jgi:hypothetical protein
MRAVWLLSCFNHRPRYISRNQTEDLTVKGLAIVLKVTHDIHLCYERKSLSVVYVYTYMADKLYTASARSLIYSLNKRLTCHGNLYSTACQ